MAWYIKLFLGGKGHYYDFETSLWSICGLVQHDRYDQEVSPGYQPCKRCEKILEGRDRKEADENEQKDA